MDKGSAGTLAVIIGAAAFPKYPDLKGGEAFAASARALEHCLASQFGADWARSHLLNLFNSPDVPRGQLRSVREFCAAHAESQRLLIYYVGHGGFFGGQNYYLALQGTEKGDEPYTGLEIRNLALVLDQCFPGKRVILILDCCFAAEAMAQFQDAGAVSRAVEGETFNAFPASGTSLLCASSKDDMALWRGTGERTMFSECLADVLTSGIPGKGERLSLREISEAVETLVRTRFGHKGVRPEVHSPRQRGADAAVEPLFRNIAYRQPEPTRLPDEISAALRNPLPQVRIGGVTALSRLAEAGGGEVVRLVEGQLRNMAEGDDSVSVRQAARLELTRLGHSATSGAQRESREDEDSTLRAAPGRTATVRTRGKSSEEPDQAGTEQTDWAQQARRETYGRADARNGEPARRQREAREPAPRIEAREGVESKERPAYAKRPKEGLAIALSVGMSILTAILLAGIGP